MSKRRHRPKPTTIYCLRNPLDKNKIFYVGITTASLKQRLYGHISSHCNDKMKEYVCKMLAKGVKPTIHEIETCTGYLQPILLEKYWIRHYSKRYKLLNSNYTRLKNKKPADRVYW